MTISPPPQAGSRWALPPVTDHQGLRHRPGLSYTPRCACGTVFPPNAMLELESKPSACRYIQRCCFLKAECPAELMLSKGTATVTEENEGTETVRTLGPPSYRYPEVTATPLLRPPAESSSRAIPPHKAVRDLKNNAMTAALSENQDFRTSGRIHCACAGAARLPELVFLRGLYLPPCNAPVSLHRKSLRETMRPTKHSGTGNLTPRSGSRVCSRALYT